MRRGLCCQWSLTRRTHTGRSNLLASTSGSVLSMRIFCRKMGYLLKVSQIGKHSLSCEWSTWLWHPAIGHQVYLGRALAVPAESPCTLCRGCIFWHKQEYLHARQVNTLFLKWLVAFYLFPDNIHVNWFGSCQITLGYADVVYFQQDTVLDEQLIPGTPEVSGDPRYLVDGPGPSTEGQAVQGLVQQLCRLYSTYQMKNGCARYCCEALLVGFLYGREGAESVRENHLLAWPVLDDEVLLPHVE